MMKTAICGAILAAGVAGPAMADSLTLSLGQVRSNAGAVMASLCDDARAASPSGCATYSARSQAVRGETVLEFKDIKPGTYAVQVFHDENGNGRPEIPPEGFAFGNDVAFPPTFAAASIQVKGEAKARASMTYFSSPAAAARPLGSQGAQPPAGVDRVDLREQGLYGELYLPHGAAHAPTLILLGGSEGGLGVISQMATSFARQGFATLALAYWAEQGLPPTLEEVRLEYFDQAVAWLKTRPEVDGRRLGVIGWSRGSEAALLLAARNQAIRAVVAVSPSGVVWQGMDFAHFADSKPAWTAKGRPLPGLKPTVAAYRPDQPLSPLFTQSLPEADRRPETAIPVERINGPVLLISGGADNLWPSTRFADRIVARLQGAGFRHGYQHLSYPEAGHVVFVGAPDGPMAKTFARQNQMMGGSPAADQAAWADDWPKTLAFFRDALKGSGR